MSVAGSVVHRPCDPRDVAVGMLETLRMGMMPVNFVVAPRARG
jgi:hypothetical protein